MAEMKHAAYFDIGTVKGYCLFGQLQVFGFPVEEDVQRSVEILILHKATPGQVEGKLVHMRIGCGHNVHHIAVVPDLTVHFPEGHLKLFIPFEMVEGKGHVLDAELIDLYLLALALFLLRVFPFQQVGIAVPVFVGKQVYRTVGDGYFHHLGVFGQQR